MRLQFISLSRHCLTLRTATVNDSVTYGVMTLFFSFTWSVAAIIIIYHMFSTTDSVSIFRKLIDSLLMMLLPMFFMFLTRGFIHNIKRNSDIVLNRKTKRIYFYLNDEEYICNINDLDFLGGLKTTYLLLYSHDRFGQKVEHKIEFDGHYNFMPIVEYIKDFIHKGSDNLRIPEKYDWDDFRQKKIYLTPAEIIEHYKPWPFCSWPCDEGERTMKVYLWPLYVVFIFPFSIISSFIWWIVCRYGKVQLHSVPKESYEGDNSGQLTP